MLDVEITGADFIEVTAVGFGIGITINSFTVVGSTQINANIAIDDTSITGTRYVSVTTLRGTGTLPDGFIVTGLPLTEGEALFEPLAPEEETPKVKLDRAPQPEALQLIPEATARRFLVVPLAITDNSLEVAMANPSDISALQILEYQSKMRIKPLTIDEKEILEAIDAYYKGFGQIEEHIAGIGIGDTAVTGQDLIQATSDAPVANALRLIIDEAIKSRASDIHIEPEEKRLRIRYRIDGVLKEVMSLPLKTHSALTSRIKIMANMNIADHLRPQDGQFSTDTKGKNIDVRVATSPTIQGEITTLRLLDKSLVVLELTQLGLSTNALEKYEDMLKVPFGMILTSGPTGAGKTTTLYASVNKLDKVTRNVITVEDPVEYRFDNINQIQVNPKAGVTFASGLRSILRLDPDVILVGEIRDAETSGIAIQSALTGHLVLSSIHANDAVGVIFRLLDLGAEPFLICSAVTGLASQRMVRRICPNCAHEIEAPPPEQLAYEKEMGEKKEKFLYGVGCEQCNFSGYRGRTGIFEIMPMTDEIRMLILKEASAVQIREEAIQEGMVPLIKDGMLKVKEGITTVSEVLRNAYLIE
jgi:general secretion pathway protein E